MLSKVITGEIPRVEHGDTGDEIQPYAGLKFTFSNGRIAPVYGKGIPWNQGRVRPEISVPSP